MDPVSPAATSTPGRRRILAGASVLGLAAVARLGGTAPSRAVAAPPDSVPPSAGSAGSVAPAPADDLTDIRRQQAAARASATRLAGVDQQAAAGLAESSAALQSAARRLAAVEAELTSAREQEAATVEQLVGARAREASVRAAMERTGQATAAAQAAVTATSAEIGRGERALGGLARAAYRSGNLPVLAEVVVGGPDESAVLTARQALGSASRSQDRELARLSALRAEQARQQARLTALGQQLATDRAEAARAVGQVAMLREQAAQRSARTRTLLAAQRTATDTARRTRDADLREQDVIDLEQARTAQQLRSLSRREDTALARARAARAAAVAHARAVAAARARAAEQARAQAAEQARAQAAEQARAEQADRTRSAASGRRAARRRPALARTVAPRPGPGPRLDPAPRPGPEPAAVPEPAPTPAVGGGRLSRPATAPITSPFGMRFHPILRRWRLHNGIDFGVGCGTPVSAAAEGRVVSSAFSTGYGNRVVVDHGGIDGIPLATTYNHLTRRLVQVGSVVRRGQVVGISGTTGLSTGCHLHFEVLDNGSVVDPMGWLS
jgi:murein DD-endopeptidase MepM/ murein hydrolase activator NlpD